VPSLIPEALSGEPMPTTDEELWRYSRIGELDLDRYTLAAADTTISGGDGIVVDAPEPGGDGAAPQPADGPDLFASLNAALATPIVLRVPAGRSPGAPIVITHRIGGEGTAVFPRLVIDAGADSEVTIIERFVSPDDVTALVVPVLLLTAGPAARVSYLAVNELGVQTWQLGNQVAVGDRDSTVTLATVALGGDYARVRTEARVSGQGGTTKQVALYFAAGDQMHDFRTIQDHDAPHTTSDLLFKGAVEDRARSVYTGLIRIREHARGTSAFQTNRNLTLSEGAWAESVPNLDIRTNDVKCSHASTVGPIDEDQRFYLESRGIEPDVAERLVVLGFFDEVLDQLPLGGAAASLADDLRERVAAKLDQRRTPVPAGS
jgi:Fe-S cluster assembly protein SufD